MSSICSFACFQQHTSQLANAAGIPRNNNSFNACVRDTVAAAAAHALLSPPSLSLSTKKPQNSDQNTSADRKSDDRERGAESARAFTGHGVPVLTNASGGRWHRRVGGGGGWRRWQGVHGVTTLALRELAAPGGARQQQQRHQPHSPAGRPTRGVPHWTAWGHCGAGGHMVLSLGASLFSPSLSALAPRCRSTGECGPSREAPRSYQGREGVEQPKLRTEPPPAPLAPPTLCRVRRRSLSAPKTAQVLTADDSPRSLSVREYIPPPSTPRCNISRLGFRACLPLTRKTSLMVMSGLPRARVFASRCEASLT